jgi:hypothetical protein
MIGLAILALFGSALVALSHRQHMKALAAIAAASGLAFVGLVLPAVAAALAVAAAH